jgi:hypothetical protein
MKEKAKWMRQVISSVRWFKISVYSSEKENDEIMCNNYNVWWVDIAALNDSQIWV